MIAVSTSANNYDMTYCSQELRPLDPCPSSAAGALKLLALERTVLQRGVRLDQEAESPYQEGLVGLWGWGSFLWVSFEPYYLGSIFRHHDVASAANHLLMTTPVLSAIDIRGMSPRLV